MADLNLPSLLPKVIDPTWFCVDKPVDDHEELCKLEEEHQAWVGVISRTHDFTALYFFFFVFFNGLSPR